MIYNSAGHNSKSKTIKQDPGAVNKFGVKEGDLTIEFRDLVSAALTKLKAKYVTDFDEENLAMYLKRIKTGNGSVVCEYHFDAAATEIATGCTAIVGTDADRLDKLFAKELADTTSSVLGVRNRGVINEADSHRGRLGLMRKEGIVSLLEIGFITNPQDLIRFNNKKVELANAIALLLVKFDNMIV